MEGIEKIVEDLKNYKEVIAIILFGSYAKGKEKPISDIDIAVIADGLEEEISCYSSRLIEVVPFFRLPLYIQFEVLKYGKVLYVGNEEKFMEVKRKVLRDYLEMAPSYERMKRMILE